MAKHEPPEVRRAQIFQSALEVCAEKGLAQTRIDDIAERAGLSKGAVYHHFRSKQDIFIGLVELFIDEARKKMEALAAVGAPMTAILDGAAEGMIQEIEAQPQLVRSMLEFYFQSARDDALRRRFNEHYESLLADFTERFRHGIESGELAADLDPEQAARIFAMAGDGLLLLHVALDDFDRAAEALRTFYRLFQRAVARTREPS